VRSEFSGPLPHPQHLRDYETFLPGSADRIIRMAEQALDHNRETTTTQQRADNRYRTLGIWLGFAVLIVLVGLAFIAGMYGNNTLAALLVGATALSAVGLFIKGKTSA
jgi:uncharacterized membrane protein